MTTSQDAEYLSAIKGLLIEALAEDRGPGRDDDALDVIADRIMQTVQEAGLVLVTEADWHDMVNAYVLEAIR